MVEFSEVESPKNASFYRSEELINILKQIIPNIDINNVSVIPFILNELFVLLKIKPEEVRDYIENSQQLHKIMVTDIESVLGDEVALPKSVGSHSYGDQPSRLINMDLLRAKGVDPAKVLVFRITQPSQEPKHELYWQTDIEAPISMYELSDQKKNSAIIMISTLEAISTTNEGVVQDQMDNNGLSFRQAGKNIFPAENVIASIGFRDLFPAKRGKS